MTTRILLTLNALEMAGRASRKIKVRCSSLSATIRQRSPDTLILWMRVIRRSNSASPSSSRSFCSPGRRGQRQNSLHFRPEQLNLVSFQYPPISSSCVLTVLYAIHFLHMTIICNYGGYVKKTFLAVIRKMSYNSTYL